MDRLRTVLLALMLLCSSTAFASVTTYTVWGVVGVPVAFHSGSEACSAAGAKNGQGVRFEDPKCRFLDASGNVVISYTVNSAQVTCTDPQQPDWGVSSQCVDAPPPPTCPYGQIMQNGVCAPIQCPAGTHYGADPDQGGVVVNRCVDDCPANTVSNINEVTHIQLCLPPNPDAPQTAGGPTCASDQVQIGFDGNGNAICMRGPDKDPCPTGTHNIGSSEAPNCTTNSPSQEKTTSETKYPETTTTGEDGSTTKTNKTETTFPDGSKQTTTTTTTTNSSGQTTTKTTTQCDRAGACGSSVGGGGSGSGSGSGDGEGEDSNDAPVSPDGDLYKKSDRTLTQVVNDFSSTVNNGSMLSAAKNFFNVQVSSGGCPNMVIAIDYFHTSIDAAPYFCNDIAQQIMSVLSFGLLLAACWVAFQIAFL